MASARKAIAYPDLQFSDPKLRRLMEHVRFLTSEVNRLSEMLEGGAAGQVLTKTSNQDFEAEWQDPT